MTARHIDQITDADILARLVAVATVSVSWTGGMPADAERWDALAKDRLPDVGLAEVRAALAHDLIGDDATAEIDMAISIACEPDGLPDCACVELMID